MKGVQQSFLLAAGFLLCFQWQWEQGWTKRIQEFTLYSGGQGELEKSQNFTENVSDLDLMSPMVKEMRLQSVCSQLGVWAFFTGKNFSTVNSYGYHPATPGWTCSSRRISADYMSPFKSIRHLGNSDLDTPSLSLYREPFFACQELYIDGQELSLPTRSEFSSFGFTGRDSWTLYSGPAFSGDSVCLLCKCDAEGIAVGVTYTAKLSLVVGSVRKGCFGNQTLHPDGVLSQDSPTNAPASVTNTWPTLSLQNTLDPNATLAFSGPELRLPYPEVFDSFAISKKSNWTIYSDTAFVNKNPMCLMHSKDGEIQYSRLGTLLVGSIKLGCTEKAAKDTILSNLITNVNPRNPGNGSIPANGTTLAPSGSSVPTTSPSSRQGKSFDLDNKTTLPSSRFDTSTPRYSGDNTSGPEGVTVTTAASVTGSTRPRPRPRPVYRPTTTQSSGTTVEELILSTNSATASLSNGSPTTESPLNNGQQYSTISVRDNKTGNSRGDAGRSLGDQQASATSNGPRGATDRPAVIEETLSTNSARTNLLGNAIPTPPTDKPKLSNSSSDANDTNGSPATESSRIVHDDDEEDYDVSEASAANIFFVAFLITLGILILAMIVALGVCVYLRATRTGNTEVSN